MEEILNNWLQEKPKDKFDKELHKYTYYDLMEFAEYYHNLQLQQAGVSSSLSISEIKERLDNCIDLYTDLFCQKQECYADGWIGNIKGGINCFSDAYLSFEDIRIDLEMNMPKGEIWKWYWDNVENGKKAINYYSYALGLRISDIKEERCDNPFCNKGNMFKKPDGEHFGCECFPNRD